VNVAVARLASAGVTLASWTWRSLLAPADRVMLAG
jgi:hypothetical protein